MKRDARLYDIVQALRDGRLHTAAELAGRLGVSTRTVDRDWVKAKAWLETLIASTT